MAHNIVIRAVRVVFQYQIVSAVNHIVAKYVEGCRVAQLNHDVVVGIDVEIVVGEMRDAQCCAANAVRLDVDPQVAFSSRVFGKQVIWGQGVGHKQRIGIL